MKVNTSRKTTSETYAVHVPLAKVLEAEGYTCLHEVKLNRGHCDVIAHRDDTTLIVEGKIVMTHDKLDHVLAQLNKYYTYFIEQGYLKLPRGNVIKGMCCSVYEAGVDEAIEAMGIRFIRTEFTSVLKPIVLRYSGRPRRKYWNKKERETL